MMGCFATVRASVQCPTCKQERLHGWQFYFGVISSMPDYVVGDAISWDGSDWRGGGETFVDAIGYCGGASFCELCEHSDALATVEIRKGRIAGVRFRSLETLVYEDYVELDGEADDQLGD